jgi:hypothetical protein
MPYTLLSCEFDARVERLKTNDRASYDHLDPYTHVYHRLPNELFYEGRLIEDAVKTPGVRSPEQSATLGIEEYDHVDALIRFSGCHGDEASFLGEEFGVVFWNVNFLRLINYKFNVANNTEVIVYSLHVDHTPYSYNFSHGDIRSMINCLPNKWKNKDAKQFIREHMTREIADNNQIAARPGQYELVEG